LSEISHKEYLSAVFLTRLLCYGTNSRLLVELRQKRGYIYSMWPGNEITPKGLVFSILTEAKDENLPEIKMIVRSTIEDIILNGVTVIELEALKKQHLQIVERSKDSTNELANLNVKYFAAFGIPFDSEAEELLVNNIEIDDIQSIADMLLKAGLSIAEMRSE
jgi:predicted Zn-dependent peptidase